MSSSSSPSNLLPPPIVYTIAGSDSGGGAGIQADLHTIHGMGGHGCSAITCLTAQNSCGVVSGGIHTPPPSFLDTQLKALRQDMPPRAIKIGMLANRQLVDYVGEFLQNVSTTTTKPWVVLDPVMISTSGHKLIDDDATQAIVEKLFAYCDVLTPNKYEAEALLQRKLQTIHDVEQGARDLIRMGVKSVLIKGGHSLDEGNDSSSVVPDEVNGTHGFAQDYFLSSVLSEGEERLCDGDRGVWLCSNRYNTEHTHGTGCTLSSALATALALGQQRREAVDEDVSYAEGATSAIYPVDACCLAKAYVTAGIARGQGLGEGPGPVVHTEFPSSYRYFPVIATDPSSPRQLAFRRMHPFGSKVAASEEPTMGRILPIVDTVEWVETLTRTRGITDIQLRVKDVTDADKILERVKACQKMCHDANVRLWINDYWQAAVDAQCFGVHLGQEDLAKCVHDGGLDVMRQANVALGVSTHSYGELAVALGVNPSYISLGPIFGTSSKKVGFDPQGLLMVRKWRQLIPPGTPFVTIGGIANEEKARLNKDAGANCVAVIGAVTQEGTDVAAAVQVLLDAMSG